VIGTTLALIKASFVMPWSMQTWKGQSEPRFFLVWGPILADRPVVSIAVEFTALRRARISRQPSALY
jgi:hypothetical protein